MVRSAVRVTAIAGRTSRGGVGLKARIQAGRLGWGAEVLGGGGAGKKIDVTGRAWDTHPTT